MISSAKKVLSKAWAQALLVVEEDSLEELEDSLEVCDFYH